MFLEAPQHFNLHIQIEVVIFLSLNGAVALAWSIATNASSENVQDNTAGRTSAITVSDELAKELA